MKKSVRKSLKKGVRKVSLAPYIITGVAILLVAIVAYSSKSSIVPGSEAASTFSSVYVSSNGQDANNGSVATPVRTLQRAVDLAQQLSVTAIFVVGPQYLLQEGYGSDNNDVTISNANLGKLTITSANSTKVTKIVPMIDETRLTITSNIRNLTIQKLAFDRLHVTVLNQDATGIVNIANNSFDNSGNRPGGGYQLLSYVGKNCQTNVISNQFTLRPGSLNQQYTALQVGSEGSGRQIIARNEFEYPAYSPQVGSPSAAAITRYVGVSLTQTTENSTISISDNNVFKTDGYSNSQQGGYGDWIRSNPFNIGVLGSYLATRYTVSGNSFNEFDGLDVLTLSPWKNNVRVQQVGLSGNRG